MRQADMVQFYVSAQESFHQTNLIEVEPTKATHNPTKTQFENTNYVILFLAPICFMIVWASVVFIVSISCKFVENRNKNEIVTSKLFQQVPCKKCRYFHNSNFLKCAVHPSIALTKEALDCSDYSPKQ
ncbi:hypothetical protein [Iningainema tapete]|uniref:Uncharacterized protein n=1 Tax=Iningainema tapete BLCC-T55 TaxID=2748662 RepID=A0A8J7C7H0_9CYAN|nr:hypothetical protein [Iningainema tapete]MBD2775634.1 hypothetical protein [Iningainema tapete BLCC-T55]